MTERRTSDPIEEKITVSESHSSLTMADHLAFVFYCFLLCIPAYAIVISAIKQNWLMVVIDVILVPVGFVHGIFLLFGAA